MKAVNIVTALFVAVLLSACGGGGGGGGGNSEPGNNNGGDFTLAQTTVNFSADMGGFQPNQVEIRGTLKNAKDQVYFVVDISKTNLIEGAYVDVLSESTGILVLIPTSPSALAPGKHVGTVTVRACKNANCSSQYSGSPKTITINYTVTAPEFSISTTTVNLSSISGQPLPEAAIVDLSSSVSPNSYGYGVNTAATEWLSIQTTWNGGSGTAAFIVTKALPIGTYTANISLFAHGESLSRSLTLTYTVKDGEQLSVSQPSFSFVYKDTASLAQAESFSIVGKTPTNWSLETDVDWLTLSTTSGNTADAAAVTAGINNNILLLPKGIHRTHITVKNLDDEDLSIVLPVVVYVADMGVEVDQSVANVFDFTATDVGTDKLNSRLFISDSQTKRVYEVDLATGLTTRYFEFEQTPESITVSPNGERMYVALLDGEHSSYWWEEDQSGSIAIFDLTQGLLLGSFDIDIDPYDLVATDAGKLVVTSGSGQWTSIKAYNASGEEVGSSGIRERSQISLHPSQEWIAATDTESSGFIEEFDISGAELVGTGLTYPLDSRVYGGFWMTPDGNQLITKGGSVILTQSMTHAGDLFTDRIITDIAFDTSSDHAMVITATNTLESYSLTDYSLVETLDDDLTDPRFVIYQDNTVYVINYEDDVFRLNKY